MSTQIKPRKATPMRRAKLVQNDRIDSVLLRLDAIQEQKGIGTFVVGVSGCERRCGTSTIVGNLAIRAAEMGLGRVLLIDADFRSPRQNMNFKLGNCVGLADIYSRSVSVEDAYQKTKISGLSVLTAGTRKAIRSCAATPENVSSMINELRTDFDLVFIDLPSELESARNQFLTRHVDGIVLVIDAQKTRSRTAKITVNTFRERNVEILGTVLNRAKRTLPSFLERWL